MRPRTHLDGIIIATPPTAWHREQAQEYFRAQEDRDPHTIAEARAPHYEGSAWYDEADEPQPTRPLTRGSQLGGVGGVILAKRPSDHHYARAEAHYARHDEGATQHDERSAPYDERSAWHDEADEPQPTRPFTRGSQLGGVGGVIIARRPSDNHYARAEAHYAQNAQLRKRRADRGSGDGGRREGSRELVVRVYREELGSVPSLASYKA